jgi:hypothetical protein
MMKGTCVVLATLSRSPKFAHSVAVNVGESVEFFLRLNQWMREVEEGLKLRKVIQ